MNKHTILSPRQLLRLTVIAIGFVFTTVICVSTFAALTGANQTRIILNGGNYQTANGNTQATATAPIYSILNSDGTLKEGVEGSFDPRGFRMSYGLNGEPRFISETAPDALSLDSDCSDGWDDRFAPAGVGGTGTTTVLAVALLGSDLYIGGNFDTAGGVVVNNIARWNGTYWSSMGSGTDDAVNALAVSGNDLYVGGAFDTAGEVTATNVARWDGSSWSAVGSGTNSSVFALAVSGGELYVGGTFTLAGGVTVNRVAKWNGANWSAFGSGMNSQVNSVAIDSAGNLYAGGSFTNAGGVTANRIAKWNGTTWSELGGGTNSTVYALAVSGTDVYAGGNFLTAGGVTVNRIAKWNGTSWSALGTGVAGGDVRSLAISGGDLYVGGAFSTASGATMFRVAKWNGTIWSAFGTGTNTTVFALAVSGSDVYAGGNFTTAGGALANNIAKWDGTKWSSFSGSGTNGGDIHAIAISGSDVYVGGSFTAVGGLTVNRVAKWDGSNWSALGSGMNNQVNALAIDGAGILYAGGSFTNAGGVTANRIAKWNGSTWSSMGSGANNIVYTLAVSGTDLYVGGQFTTTGGVTVNRIARWNGATWSALDSGTDGIIYAVAVSGSDLYAGGVFSTAGGVPVGRIAKWDGAAWSSLEFGAESNTTVYSLAVSGSDLYAGGQFSTAGGTSANYIAKWNGTSWSGLGSGPDSEVRAIAVSGSDLYVGGSFATAGGVTVNNIAKWDGMNWSVLGSGMNKSVYAVAVSGTSLFVGGSFTTAGCHGSGGFARYDTGTVTPTPTPTPEPSPTQTPCSGTIDPAFGSNGTVTTPVSRTNSSSNAVAVQPDGKTIVAGSTIAMIPTDQGILAQNMDFAVVRYNLDGSLDMTFGDGGTVITDFGTRGDAAYSVAVQSDGKIVAAGRKSTTATGSSSAPGDFALARYNTDGSPDTTFGVDGKVTTDLGGGTEQADSVAIQSDGKIVAAGRSNGFGIARYNSDGSLDPTFGNGGIIQGTLFTGRSMALQSDGKIVLAGLVLSGTSVRFAAARFSTDGLLDESFNGGLVQADVPGIDDEARSVAIAPDGKIVLAGVTYAGGCGPSGTTVCRRFGTVRFNTDGTLDTSFGGTGIVILSSNPANPSYEFNEGWAAAVQPDSKIVVAGFGGMVRYSVNGELDGSFGSGGGVAPSSLGLLSVAISPDGGIVSAGQGGGYFSTVKYLSNGVTDVAFGNDGAVITSVGSGYDVAQSIALTQDGRIVAAGNAQYINTNLFALAQYNADGSLDTSFGTDGKVTTQVASGNNNSEGARSVALQSDGKIVTAGYANVTSPAQGHNFALVRYNPDGSPDPSFGFNSNGIVITHIAVEQAFAVAIQADGRIVAAGSSGASTNSLDFALIRYTTNGLLDASFGSNGIVTTPVGNSSDEARSMAIQPDGKIVLAGYARISSTNTDIAIVRYNENGSLDNTFGAGGKVLTNIGSSNEEANALVIQPDGKIVVAGFAGNGASDDFAIIRYNPDGSLDAGFGSGGKVTTSIGIGSDTIRSINIQPDGKLVAVGSSSNGSELGFAVARYNSSGTLDATFGIGGVIVTTAISNGNDEAFASAIDPEGRIIAAGYGVVDGNTDYAVVRYSDNCSTATPVATISGRVLTPSGLGLRSANVSLIDSQGVRRTVITSNLGFYSFENVRLGEQHTLSVASRRYRFASRIETFASVRSDVDFVGLE